MTFGSPLGLAMESLYHNIILTIMLDDICVSQYPIYHHANLISVYHNIILTIMLDDICTSRFHDRHTLENINTLYCIMIGHVILGTSHTISHYTGHLIVAKYPGVSFILCLRNK